MKQSYTDFEFLRECFVAFKHVYENNLFSSHNKAKDCNGLVISPYEC